MSNKIKIYIIWFVLTLVIFIIFINFFSNGLYVAYANYFQGGMLYEGETRTKMFTDFLGLSLVVIGFISALFLFIYFKTKHLSYSTSKEVEQEEQYVK